MSNVFVVVWVFKKALINAKNTSYISSESQHVVHAGSHFDMCQDPKIV